MSVRLRSSKEQETGESREQSSPMSENIIIYIDFF